jgi:superkiller protein 3
MALVQSGKQMEAYRAFIEATEINPGYADAWFHKGTILAKTGKYTEAIAAYEKAVKIDPKFAKAWYNLSTAYHMAKKHEDSTKAYNEAVKLDPKYNATPPSEQNKGKGFHLPGHSVNV